MNHSNRIPTATVDQDEASLVRAQMVVFSSGNWLSREAFQELATPAAPRGVELFKLLVRTTIALHGQNIESSSLRSVICVLFSVLRRIFQRADKHRLLHPERGRWSACVPAAA